MQRGRKRTIAGYYDAAHRSDLVEQAAKLNADGAGVYVVMNPLDPQLERPGQPAPLRRGNDAWKAEADRLDEAIRRLLDGHPLADELTAAQIRQAL